MKNFDCVEMKRKAQTRIYNETQGMSHDDELAYFESAANESRIELARLRKELSVGKSAASTVARIDPE